MFWLQIGGVRAPSPVGELGNVEMTQAVSLAETSWQVVGPDMLLTGVPPTSSLPASSCDCIEVVCKLPPNFSHAAYRGLHIGVVLVLQLMRGT